MLGMRNSRNMLLNKESRGHVGATSSLNNKVANLVLDGSARSFPFVPCHKESLRHAITSLKRVHLHQHQVESHLPSGLNLPH